MEKQNSIIEEVAEINGLLNLFCLDVEKVTASLRAITSHPSYQRVMEMSAMLEAFSNGQPKPIAAKPAGQKRVRRSREEIEAAKVNA